MEVFIANAVVAWKAADQAATDAEGLLRVQVLKYAEGISGPPSLKLVRETEELRRVSNEALAAAMGILRTDDALLHEAEPHSGLAPL